MATCVVAVCMYKKVHMSRKNEKYTSQEGNETENIYTIHNLDISIYRFPSLSYMYANQLLMKVQLKGKWRGILLIYLLR